MTDKKNQRAQHAGDFFKRAQKSIPGGVNSPVRSFASVGGEPFFVSSAKGASIQDESGNSYLDYVQSYGPNIFGHTPAFLQKALKAALKKGNTYGAPTLREILLAEKLCELVDGLEMVRLVSSGTEAAMSAIRLARGATGRAQIIKFGGCYHGHADVLLAEGGSGVASQGISGKNGVTQGATADTIVATYNQVPEITSETAAVILEPVAANMGVVAPKPGFLEELRKSCDKVGALLIFDEVITGFRLAPGGAAQIYDVVPDMWCFGKIIGGGLPMGAFGGSRHLMSHLAPLGEVYQAGTLSGNPLATAAGLAVLNKLDETIYKELKEKATYLARGLRELAEKIGLPLRVIQVESLLGLFFGNSAPANFEEVKEVAENGLYPKFFHAMLQRGIFFAPGAYEAVFLSTAHSQADLDKTLSAAGEVFKEISPLKNP